MLLVRSVQADDLDALVELARRASFGLTTLMADPERMARRIETSESGEAPLLVMVGEAEREVIGTAGILTRVGDARKAEPFYAYRLERSVHHSDALGVHKEVDALHLVKAFDGPTEIGTLFLHPEHRGGGNGRILSLSRFLLIAREPDRYAKQVITELRGVIDENGRSPFWDALGRHFFGVDYPVADDLSARDKRFIAELMPAHPIYVPLLPPEAREVIGKVHPLTQPARKLLEEEGFHFADMVDIFDAGPCLRCDTAAIRTVRESTVYPVLATDDALAGAAADTLISPVDGPFRLAAAAVTRLPKGLRIAADVGQRLSLGMGDRARIVSLRPAASETGQRQRINPEHTV